MAIDKTRRQFLARDIFSQTLIFLKEIVGSYKEEEAEEKENYFESFENCYPLLSEAGGLLMDEAIKQGVETKGKSKLEIAKEIFSSQVQSKRIVEKGVK